MTNGPEKITLTIWEKKCEFEFLFGDYGADEKTAILDDVWKKFINLSDLEQLLASTKQHVEDFCMEIINDYGPDEEDPEYAEWTDGIVDGKITNIFDFIEPMYILVKNRRGPKIGIAFNTYEHLNDKNLVIVFSNNQFKEVTDEPSFL